MIDLGRYNNSKRRYFFLIFFALATLSIGTVVYTIFKKATIKIKPKINQINESIPLIIDSNAKKVDLNDGVIPGKVIEVFGTYENSYPATGEKKIESFAKGKVIIKNNWKKDFYLKEGAQLVQGESPESLEGAEKNIFVTDQDVTVPAYGQIEAAVTAKIAGPKGNIEPGKFYFLKMSRWNRERIWAENTETFSGGVSVVNFVSNEDFNNAVDNAKKELIQKIINQESPKIAFGNVMRPELALVEPSEINCDKPINSEAKSFTLKVSGKVIAIVFNEVELKTMAIEKFKESTIGKEFEILNIEKSSVNYELTEKKIADGRTSVNANISARLIKKLPSKLFEKKSIMGYNDNALRERYSKYQEIENVEVEFFPFWVKTVPSIESQINFEIINF